MSCLSIAGSHFLSRDTDGAIKQSTETRDTKQPEALKPNTVDLDLPCLRCERLPDLILRDYSIWAICY